MNHRDLAKLITKIESKPECAQEILKGLPERTARVFGFTGSPGVGKSSLVDQIILNLRKQDKLVAVVAVDPSSPFTKGAFLGDRIRMKRHFTDDGVFIRSMASRGALGGLCDAIFDVVSLLEKVGFDYVLVETVGIGQSEVEIRYVADVVVLVMSPGFGDEIQMLKSGVMEIADVYVINKIDLPESDSLYTQLTSFLSLAGRSNPVLKTTATVGDGVENLVRVLDSLWSELVASGELLRRRKNRVKHHAEHMLRRIIESKMGELEEETVQGYVTKALKRICSSE